MQANSFKVYVLPGHSFGHWVALPVESVHPGCHMVPIYSFLVAMHKPLSKQMSAPVVRFVAQHPLCLAVELHGLKVSSSSAPVRL